MQNLPHFLLVEIQVINLAQSPEWIDSYSSVKLHLPSLPYVPYFSHTDVQKLQLTMLSLCLGFSHAILSTEMQPMLPWLTTSQIPNINYNHFFFTELKTFDPQIYTTVKWNFWARLAFLEHTQSNKMQVNENFVF